MKNTFKISYFLKHNARRKNGNTPIIGRITINGERAEFSPKIEVNPALWSVEFGKAKGRSAEAQRTNEALEAVSAIIHNNYNRMLEAGEVVTAAELKHTYTQVGKYPESLLGLFRKHNDDAMTLCRHGKLSYSICKKYELAYRRTRDFLLEKRGVNDIALSALTMIFIRDFELYLRTQCKLGINQTAKMIQFIKRITRMAHEVGIIRTDPFKDHRSKWKTPDIKFLTHSELQRIVAKEITVERLAIVRDLFVFSSYTGLSYVDIKELTMDYITTMPDDSMWIIQSRHKTGHMARIPLLSIPLAMIEKYSSKKSHGECIFPVMSNQKMNSYLKELADICEVRKNLTFHMSRHTFSTTVCLDNGISVETLSRMLGHINIKTTQIYAKITDKKVGEEMKMLEMLITKR